LSLQQLDVPSDENPLTTRLDEILDYFHTNVLHKCCISCVNFHVCCISSINVSDDRYSATSFSVRLSLSLHFFSNSLTSIRLFQRYPLVFFNKLNCKFPLLTLLFFIIIFHFVFLFDCYYYCYDCGDGGGDSFHILSQPDDYWEVHFFENY